MNEPGFREDHPVPVSAVITASICPMQLFLESRSGGPRHESQKYTICKQISSHLGGPLDPVQIWNEVSAIIPHVDVGLFDFMDTCIARCNEGGPWLDFNDTEVYLQSKKHGLSGNIDKIHDHEPFLSIVRAVDAPPAGVYGSDRLRVFGYMLLMNEALGVDIGGGSVEYIPSGVVRTCTPGPIDKRRFFRALKDARDILSGKNPPRPRGVKCQGCESLEACKPTGRRLSDIL